MTPFFSNLDKFPFTPAPAPAPEWWDNSEEDEDDF